jgi:hypothetical protein
MKFEIKRMVLFVFEKDKKKKKTSPPHLSARSGPPAQLPLPQQPACLLFLFLFLCTADRVAPPVRPPSPSSRAPFPSSV